MSRLTALYHRISLSPRTQSLGVLLLFLGLITRLLWCIAMMLKGGWAADYLAFATGGRLVEINPRGLYDVHQQAIVQSGILGYTPANSPNFPQLFVNPPLAAELMRPVAFLPLQVGTDIFGVLSVMALFLSMFLLFRFLEMAPRRAKEALVLLGVLSIPGSFGILLGQWDPLLLLVGTGALLLLKKHPLAAGLLLSLLLIKPQLVFLLLPVWLIGRQWRPLLGFCAGALLFAASTIAVIGISGLGSYANALAGPNLKANLVSRSIPGILGGLTRNPQAASWIALPVVLFVLVLFWNLRKPLQGSAALGLGIGIFASIFAAPHINNHDLLLVALPLVITGRLNLKAAILWAVALNVAVLFDLFVVDIHLDGIVLLVTAVGLFYWERHWATIRSVLPAEPENETGCKTTFPKQVIDQRIAR